MTDFESRLKEYVINPELAYPRDVYSLGQGFLAWILFHQVVYWVVIRPISFVWFPDPPKVKSSHVSDSGVDLSSTSSSAKSDSELRKRKTGNVRSSSPTHRNTQSENVKYAKAAEEAYTLRQKFHVAAFKWITYTASTILGVVLLSQESWALSPKDWAPVSEWHPMSTLLRVYYHLGVAVNAHGIILFFAEPKQSWLDFFVIMTHHSSTVFLIVVSYLGGAHRIGSVILFLHDLSDPFMEFAKMCFYRGYQKTADVLFALFAIVFIVSRNIIFPFFVILSIPRYFINEDGTPSPSAFVVYGCLLFLCVLECLHIYWAYLIVTMAMRAFKNDGSLTTDDIRTDDK